MDGPRGKRFTNPQQSGSPLRDRTDDERAAMQGLAEQEEAMRNFLLGLSLGADGRSLSTALTKLDEMVMWAKRAIDA